jgi:hypothetical protein
MSTADRSTARGVRSTWICCAAVNVLSTATFVPPARAKSTSGVSASGSNACVVIMKPSATWFLIRNCR